MASNLSIALTIGASVGGAISGIKQLGGALTSLRNSELSTSQKITQLGKASIGSLKMATMPVVGLGGAIMGLSQPAIAFESAMADVKKVVDFDTPKQFKEMEKDILSLTRTIPMAGDEIAAIVAAGGQAGIARESLIGYAEDAAKMGVAFDMAAGDAGTAMATMANVLNKPISEMAKFGDAINHLSDNANSKAADIVNVITRSGSDTRMLGLTENQAAALGSTFLSMGKAPELAAQAIKGMSSAFAELKAGKHAKELQMLGLSPKNFADSMNKDAQGAISDFIARVKELPKDKQYPILAKMFGKQYADDMMLLAQNTEEYNRQLELLEERDDKGNLKFIGSMQKEFESRAATTENNLIQLKNSFTDLGISIGSYFLPIINEFVNKLKPVVFGISDWVKANPALINQIIEIGGYLVGAWSGFFLVSSGISAMAATGLALFKSGQRVLNVLRFLSPVVLKLAYGFGYMIGTVAKGAIMFVKAFAIMGRALLTNPIGLIITGIAVAAYLIYDNWGAISTWFSELWANVKAIFLEFSTWVQGMWTGVSDWFSSSWQGVTDFFSNFWVNIENFFTSGIANITTTILNWSPLGLFQKVFSGVLSWFGVDLPNEFSEFGSNIISGLTDGISNAWDSAKEKVAELGSGIKNWFAEQLGIHSPSRVFMGFGENTVQGLAIGIDRTLPLVENASNDMAESITPNIAYPSLQQTYKEQQSQRQTQAINGGMVVNFNPTIQVQGNSSQEILNDVKKGLKMSLTEFERMLERVIDQKQRRAY